jgi:hypothetical protein
VRQHFPGVGAVLVVEFQQGRKVAGEFSIQRRLWFAWRIVAVRERIEVERIATAVVIGWPVETTFATLVAGISVATAWNGSSAGSIVCRLLATSDIRSMPIRS